VTKQVEPIPVIATIEGQSGSGSKESDNLTESEAEDINGEMKSKLGPKLYHSFQHPKFVKTEKILFDLKRKAEQSEESGLSKKKKQDIKSGESKALSGGSKTSNIKHNFQFY